MRALGNNPLSTGYVSLYPGSNSHAILTDGASDSANSSGVYSMTVFLNADMVSGTLRYFVDPYNPGEGSSSYYQYFERPISGFTVNAFNSRTEDFAFRQRPLTFSVNGRNGHVPTTWNYLYFDEFGVWSGGVRLCNSINGSG